MDPDVADLMDPDRSARYRPMGLAPLLGPEQRWLVDGRDVTHLVRAVERDEDPDTPVRALRPQPLPVGFHFHLNTVPLLDAFNLLGTHLARVFQDVADVISGVFTGAFQALLPWFGVGPPARRRTHGRPSAKRRTRPIVGPLPAGRAWHVYGARRGHG